MSDNSSAPSPSAAPAAPQESSSPMTLKDALSSVVDEIQPKEPIQAEGEESDEGEESSEEMSQQEIKELKKKLKLKVYGKEIEDEIDWNDEDGIKKRLQKSHAFDHVSQEYSKMKDEVADFVKQLKSDPASILKELGLDFDSLAEKHLESIIEEAKKSPEQIAREKMEKELKDLKEEKDRLAKEREQAQLEALRNEQAAIIESDIQSALEATETVLPKKNPWVLKKVAETMLLAMQNGYPNVTAKEVIPFVEDQFKNDLKSMFDVFPEEIIENLVGKPNLDRLRKKRLKNKVNTKTAKQIVSETGEKVPKNEESERNKKSYRDFFNKFD